MGQAVFSLQVMLASLVALTCAYRQRVIFHDAPSDDVQGNVFKFETQIPDNTHVRSGKAVRMCMWGSWDLYEGTEYTSSKTGYYASNGLCFALDNFNGYSSFRYNGASETTDEAISLYKEPNLRGKELFVESDAGGFEGHKSLVSTGAAGWMLFEGRTFNGTSACAASTNTTFGDIHIWNDVSELGLRSVGSVRKYCDVRAVDELQAIKEDININGFL